MYRSVTNADLTCVRVVADLLRKCHAVDETLVAKHIKLLLGVSGGVRTAGHTVQVGHPCKRGRVSAELKSATNPPAFAIALEITLHANCTDWSRIVKSP